MVGNDSPAWSPDGTRIAFTSFRNGKGDIYVMNADGGDARRLTTSPAYDDLPAWSPDGRRIAFTSDRDGSLQIYAMNADGGGQTRLTSSLGSDYSPTWSPDGHRIAFRSDRDGNSEIYAMNADGGGQTRLTSSPGSDNSPSWGPDGRIAFASDRGDGSRTSIWAMNADGSDQRRITIRPRAFWSESRPSWSADGKKLLFLADRDVPVGNIEIYSMNADGTGDARLTTYPGHDDAPAFSPDGRRIAFSRGASFLSTEIYVMAADGSGPRELTTPKLGIYGYLDRPAKPVAGRTFTSLLVVLERSGADLDSPALTCSARVGKTRLLNAGSSFEERSARCAWKIPARAHGRLLAGAISVTSRGETVRRSFSLRVR